MNTLQGSERGAVSSATKTSRRFGITVLELLVTVGIIGLLLALILPAVHAAREAARQVQCKNNLRQIGLAMHNYHEQHDSLPAAWQWNRNDRKSAFGWAVRLLPFIEQGSLHDQIRPESDVDSAGTQQIRHHHLTLLVCPSDLTEPTFRLYEDNSHRQLNHPPELLTVLPTANYVGVFGTFEPDDAFPPPEGNGAFRGAKPVQFADFQRGLSQTLLVGEREMARVPSTWFGVDFRGEDAACRIVGHAEKGPNNPLADECEFGSRHSGATNFLWGDGRVEPISDSIETTVYRRLATRRGY